MVKKWIMILAAIVVSLGLAFLVGCESDAQTGALIGTAAGAGVGQAIGRDTKSTLIGAGVGAAGGYMVGNEQDKKKTKTEMGELRQEMNTVTVNVTNSNGSVTPVTLRKQGVGYVGPRGEYYSSLPTSKQLKPVYGF
jgi:hypothetical protein